MYEERLFWLKFNRLEEVYRSMHFTAMQMFKLSGVYSDNHEKQQQISKEICESILHDFLVDSHYGAYYIINQRFLVRDKETGDYIRLEQNVMNLIDALNGLYDIAKLHFDIFKKVDDENQYPEEDTSFCDYLLQDPDIIDELKETVQQCPNESKRLKFTKLIEDLDDAFSEYKKDFNYPEENETAEDYLERMGYIND